MRLHEITEVVGLHRGTVFRLLQALQSMGWVDRREGEAYVIGLELFRLGRHTGNADLSDVALPELQWLVEHTEETSHLVVLHQSAGLYLAKVESGHSLRVPSQVGRSLPLHCTGVGKAILAHLDPEQVLEIVHDAGLPRFTPHTICDEEVLLAELDLIRAQGFSVDREEIEIGLRCVAAPFFDSQGKLAGGISIAGPAARLDDNAIKTKSRLVKDAAARISRRLGYSGPLLEAAPANRALVG